jgi:hypothetical protein
MSRGLRAGLLAAAAIVLVVAFVLLRPSGDDDGPVADAPTATPTPTPTATATPAAGETETAAPTPTPRPTADPDPLLTGGTVRKIRVDKGESVRFRVRSPEAEEVHIHGYDIKRDLKAGRTASVSFKATIDGIFEIEFEHAGMQIAELRVDP